jgi:diguanylate cyclase (GGDEF)-like protein
MPDTRRILVIDDNTAIHADFRKILAPAGSAASGDDSIAEMAAALFGEPKAPARRRTTYDVVCASQGQEGLELVRQALAAGKPFHVAFVDIRMPPGWDGIETIEHLWKEDPYLQTVICSAYSDYSWDDINARLGDSDRLLLLKKPFDTVEISQLAAALGEKYRLAVAARARLDELDRLVRERTAELERANLQLLAEVEQRRSVEERLRHDVLHDRLTGLPNRAMLMDRIEQCIRRRQRDANYKFALLFMDMDDFKVVNDSLGHDVGDRLLVGIATRLASAVRSADVAMRLADDVTSRLGGDEFVILLDGISERQDAIDVARRIETLMAEPFALDGHEVVAHLSIGIAFGHEEYERAPDILRDADTAVYRAKGHGKHRYAVFDAQMHSQARERLELETDLRRAIGAGQFFLHYQPVVSLTDGNISGFEALLRWQHPTRGLVMPNAFIHIAESCGLIVPMGLEALREACRQLAQWRCRLGEWPVYRNLWLSVNVSARQLHLAGLVSQFDAVLAEFGLDRDAIKLEITENVVMQHGDVGMETLKHLRQHKYRLSLDDFGTGYSSLSHLHHMPVDCVKIDQSFIRKIDSHSRPYSATVQAIVNLAHDCGMSVVGEGVETIPQLVQLQTIDCDLAQGFWFSRPVPAPEAEQLLLDNLGSKLWRPRVQQLASGIPSRQLQAAAPV